MAKTSLSLELQAKYTAEYLDLLDRIDNLEVELKDEVKERKGEIAALKKGAFRLRRLLAGREDDQLEVPGAEVPHVKPRPGTTTISFDGKDVAALGKAAGALEEMGRGRKNGKRRS
jgi:hypothetical protein